MVVVVLYALGVWILVSLPAGLFFGAMCRMNQLSQDGGELFNFDRLAHSAASAPRLVLQDDRMVPEAH